MFHPTSDTQIFFSRQMLSNAYKKELERFDAERVLPLWDNMVAQQQERLLQAGVPTMFITSVSADREVSVCVHRGN